MEKQPAPTENATLVGRRVFMGLAGSVLAGAGATYVADRLGIINVGDIIDDLTSGQGDPGAGATGAEGTPGEPGLPLPPEADRSREVNLLVPEQWQYTPGVEPAKRGLAVAATGLAVRRGIGTDTYATARDYDAYIPMNRYGVHLKQGEDDFVMAAEVAEVKKGEEAVLLFGSAPHNMFDERVDSFPGLTVTVKSDKLVASVAGMPQEIAFDAPAEGTNFWFKQQGGRLVVGVGDRTVAFDHNMFKATGEVWFGLDASKGGSFNLAQLKAYPVEGGSIEAVDTSKLKLGELDPQGFQAIASRKRPDMMIGTALDLTPVARHESYADLVGANVGVLKTEMLGKMLATVTGSPDKNGFLKEEDFTFDDLDAFFDMAERSGKKVHLHTILFNEALPAQIESFLKDVAEGRKSKEAGWNLLDSYMNILLGRYKDRESLYAVDVVNEPLQDYSDETDEGFDLGAGRVYREGAWFKAFGKPVFERAFQNARKILGKRVLLGANDFGAETDDDRATALVNIFGPLGRKGLVDFVGLQAHLDTGDDSDVDTWSEEGEPQESYVYDDMTTRFKQFARAGLDVMISEMSIDSGDQELQYKVSRGMMRAAMDAPNVKSVCWWGLATGDFYMTSEGGSLGNDAPWAWENGRPVEKETVRGIKEGLAA
jgi:GH35 family endo-1,4-beta-xylanase